MGKDKAFQPSRSEPFLNADGTVSLKWDAYLSLIGAKANDSGTNIDEVLDALYMLVTPSISNLSAQLFEQSKEVSDIVQEIAQDKSRIDRNSATLSESGKIVSDHREIIASLLATVGALSTRLSEATKPRTIQFESAAYQILDNDSGVVADASGGDFDVTLPDPVKNKDKDYFLTSAGGSGSATLKPFASESIAGSTSLVVPSTVPETTAKVKSDGTDWSAV